MSRHRDWTHAEWETCKRMQAEGHGYKAIAAALNRPVGGIKMKIYKMGYAGESAKDRHRVERESLALALLHRGIKGRAMMRAMGCGQTQACKYKQRLTPILKGN